MNIIVYDPQVLRLQQTAEALGQTFSVQPVQAVSQLVDIPIYQLAIFHEDIDPAWVASVVQHCPNTIVLIGMETRGVENIRNWSQIGVHDTLAYPIKLDRVLRALPPAPTVEPATAATQEVAVPPPVRQSPPPVVPLANGMSVASPQRVPEPFMPQPMQPQQPNYPQQPVYESAPVRQKVIAVVSARGGAGKTTITYNLATLAARGLKTVVVDLDPKGNMSIVSRTDTPYTADAWSGLQVENIGDGRVKNYLSPMKCGAYLLASGQNVEGIDSETLNTILHILKRQYDLVLIDCAPGLTPRMVEACLKADEVLCVIPDDPGAYTGSMQLIKQLHSHFDIHPEKIKIVFNRVDKDFDSQVEQVLREHTRCAVIAKLPIFPDMKKRVASGIAAVTATQSKSKFAPLTSDLLRQLITVPEAEAPTKRSGGMFGGLFRRKG